MQPHHAPADQTPARVPTSVYRYYDEYDVLLYVGITSRGIARNLEHNTSKEWFRFVTRQEVEHLKSRGAALNRENRLIRQYQPPFNKQGNPEHEAAREAYYLFRETPRAGRDNFINGNRGDAEAADQRLPKTLWFRPVRIVENVMLLECTDAPAWRWTFVNTPSRLQVKNHARRRIGALLSAARSTGGTTIRVSLDPGQLPPSGVLASVKWPPPGGPTCIILNLQSANLGGLRP